MTEINDFCWGPVVEVHGISEIQVVEYHPAIYDGPHFTGEYEDVVTHFHPFLRGVDLCKGFDTLDKALLCGLAMKYDYDHNSQAHKYAARVLGII